jgi:hypothetical protein
MTTINKKLRLLLDEDRVLVFCRKCGEDNPVDAIDIRTLKGKFNELLREERAKGLKK